MTHGGTLTIATSNADIDETMPHRHGTLYQGRYALVTISDTGVELDADAIGRLFEPIFKTSDNGKLSGLGLANAYGIVKQSGGTIAVASEPGRGTIFRIYLPSRDSVPPSHEAGERHVVAEV
jgi:two-component system cell cycle sensor histidine kinase/response regulator CckA